MDVMGFGEGVGATEGAQEPAAEGESRNVNGKVCCFKAMAFKYF